MTTKITVTLDIDFALLREQKRVFLEMPFAEYRAFEGVVGILDFIQDTAVADGLLTEEEVFGSEEL